MDDQYVTIKIETGLLAGNFEEFLWIQSRNKLMVQGTPQSLINYEHIVQGELDPCTRPYG